MKKIFQDCMIAVIFTAICSVIAVIMGLIERRDNNKDNKRRPFGPSAILIYTTEWVNCEFLLSKYRFVDCLIASADQHLPYKK